MQPFGSITSARLQAVIGRQFCLLFSQNRNLEPETVNDYLYPDDFFLHGNGLRIPSKLGVHFALRRKSAPISIQI